MTVTVYASGVTVEVIPRAVTPPPPPQPVGSYPLSADFVSLAPDPRGRDIGYGMLKRLPNGHAVTFGGDSHDCNGNNAVMTYDPVANAWTTRISHTPTAWVSGQDVSGKAFLGNRDNHNPMVKGSDVYVVGGERGIYLIGNLGGKLDTATWQWTISDAAEPLGLPKDWINCASGFVGNVGYLLAGDRNGNPNAGLVRVNADGTLSQWWNVDNELPFPGAQNLRYISNSHFVRNGLVYVYGGFHYKLAGQPAPSSVYGSTLFACNLLAPSMVAVSDNPLPNPVKGGAIIADYIAARDWMICTDGKAVNVYDFADGSWHAVPVNTPADPDRETPSSGGAGRQGFWSPETNQLLLFGGHSKMYGLRLNF